MLRSKSGAARAAALVAGAALVLSACGGGDDGGDGDGAQTGQIFAECDANPNECNSAPADQLQDGGEVTMALEKDIANWNLNSSEGNVFETGMALKGVLPSTFVSNPDLKFAMNEDVLESAEQVNTNPQTIEYKIKQEAVWSDGTPISAEDFIYIWKTQNGRDCPDCAVATTAGYDQVRSVEGSDNGKTVTVTYEKPFTDWQQLWESGQPIYPAHIAKQHGDLNTPQGLKSAFDWFGANMPTYSGGPYKIEDFQKNRSLTLVPNERWWGEKPKLDRIIFRIITDAAQEPTALQNNEVQIIYPQPQVDLVNQVRNIPNVSSYVGLGLTWEHFDFNLDTPALKDKALRQALFTAVDRQALIDGTVGQFTDKVEPLNSNNFMPQQEGYEDVISETGQGSGNIEKAKQILTDAGYKQQGDRLMAPNGQPVPELSIRYTTGNQIRQDSSELFAQSAKQLGVTVNVSPTDDLGGTLESGEYDIMLFAWVASPYPFANAVQNWTTGQGNNFGNYSNPDVDRLLNEAAAATDRQDALAKVNEANRIMAQDAYVLPLYQKPTFIAAYDNLANVRNNSTLDGPVYNIGEWGIRQG
ncbi:ABC transporter substrate-binding protein [Prauserella sp. PE36]|uniref:ABC transporter family substrate-binding protein n=1 Tax=Prauserella endophytica TaxID=1592324 RepID=A0ABY2RSN3_9PSEU|nr:MULTISPECIES: ABC transporter family substrate-binding protein [Prauserella]PXY26620.1 ABC transporter substrate-binding protein [Prauserella coralliicola]RBM10543.1 ABC transporter substrate-binding protein [Prauserella sp. PE36]TKG58723.1 ABC transporter family substrate-binding protein [Prauserella endophytica]